MYPGRKIIIEEHLNETEIDELLNENKEYYILYKRLSLLKLLLNGESVKSASNKLCINRATGSRWLKEYNEKGLEGLNRNYENCGRKSKLTDDQLKQLKEHIENNEEHMTLKILVQWIKDEFNIEYSQKQVWVIVKQKLGLNWDKPSTT